MLSTSLSLLIIATTFVTVCGQSLFHSCDRDRNFQLNKQEFVLCFRGDDLYDDEGFEALFDHLDANGDGSITATEYNKAQETLFRPKATSSSEEETVSFTDRDGVTRQVPLKSVYKKMEENMKGFKRTDDNRLMKEESKTSKVSELSEKDPQIDAIIKMGNWSFQKLIEWNVVAKDAALKSMVSDDLKFRSRRVDTIYFPKFSSSRSSMVNITLKIHQSEQVIQYKV